MIFPCLFLTNPRNISKYQSRPAHGKPLLSHTPQCCGKVEDIPVWPGSFNDKVRGPYVSTWHKMAAVSTTDSVLIRPRCPVFRESLQLFLQFMTQFLPPEQSALLPSSPVPQETCLGSVMTTTWWLLSEDNSKSSQWWAISWYIYIYIYIYTCFYTASWWNLWTPPCGCKLQFRHLYLWELHAPMSRNCSHRPRRKSHEAHVWSKRSDLSVVDLFANRTSWNKLSKGGRE